MRREFFYIIAGVLIVVVASSLLVFSGTRLELSEEGEKLSSGYILFMGELMLVCGIVVLSGCFHTFGKGKPRFLSDAGVNHIYEVIGTVLVDEEKIITVLKEQGGKIRLFEFTNVPEAKFIKIIKLEKGEKTFQLFPPSKETSPSEGASLSEVP